MRIALNSTKTCTSKEYGTGKAIPQYDMRNLMGMQPRMSLSTANPSCKVPPPPRERPNQPPYWVIMWLASVLDILEVASATSTQEQT